jgi:hypothetical protein
VRLFYFLLMKNIVAFRDGVKANFHPNTWANMPEGRYGWEEVRQAPAPPPPVVVQTMQAVKPSGIPLGTTVEMQTKKPRQKRAK